MAPLNYLSNFWRTLEMPLINCEVNLILTWSSTCVIINSTGAGTFAIRDAKLYLPVVTLSTQDSSKLLQQLKSGFKRTVNWNKYLLKRELIAQNQNLNHLVEPSFQGVNRLFVLGFEYDTQRTLHSGYYLRNVEIKDYNNMINGEDFFDQPIKNNKVTYKNIRKIATGQGDDYTTGCLLDYPYFKDTYKMTEIDLSKQQALDAGPRANLTNLLIGNLDDKTNFPQELLLTNTQVSNLRKAFAKHTSTHIKLSKTQLSKMIQSGGFLDRLLGPLLRTGLPLMKIVIKPLAKSVLVSLGLAAAASAADAGIHKKVLGSGHNNTTLIISKWGNERYLKNS